MKIKQLVIIIRNLITYVRVNKNSKSKRWMMNVNRQQRVFRSIFTHLPVTQNQIQQLTSSPYYSAESDQIYIKLRIVEVLLSKSSEWLLYISTKCGMLKFSNRTTDALFTKTSNTKRLPKNASYTSPLKIRGICTTTHMEVP